MVKSISLCLVSPTHCVSLAADVVIGQNHHMGLLVEHWNSASDGELNEASMRQKLENRGYRVARYVYPPGTHFPDHTHEVDKIDAVLSGRFMMRMDGTSVILEAGDSLAVPRGVIHRAEVVGNEPVVSLDAVRS